MYDQLKARRSDLHRDRFQWRSRSQAATGRRHQHRRVQSSRHQAIVAAITSNFSPPYRHGDVLLTGWQTAGLIKPSALRGVLATIDKRDIFRSMGHLTDNDFAKMDVARLSSSLTLRVGVVLGQVLRPLLLRTHFPDEPKRCWRQETAAGRGCHLLRRFERFED